METKQSKPALLENRLLLSKNLSNFQSRSCLTGSLKISSDATKKDSSVSGERERMERPHPGLCGNLNNTLLHSASLRQDLTAKGLQNSNTLGIGGISLHKNPVTSSLLAKGKLSQNLSSSQKFKTNIPALEKTNLKLFSSLNTSAVNRKAKLFDTKSSSTKKEKNEFSFKQKVETCDNEGEVQFKRTESQEQDVPVSRQTYKFELDEDSLPQFSKEKEKSQYNFSSKIEKENPLEKQKRNIATQKCAFLNQAAVAIVEKPNYYDKNDQFRRSILKSIKELKEYEPEFILKVALYLRKDLNIRTCAHFILAAAAFQPECRPYLKRYFAAIIVLPSDWIEVAEFYVSLNDKNLNFGSLPTALRKVMIEKFPSFDEYQLAKYNKEKARLKKGKKQANDIKGNPIGDVRASLFMPSSESESDSDSESEEEIQRKAFTLKQLIRKLHISEPVHAVMCLIGKTYPSTREEFRLSRLEGTWQEDRAGKRMKLPTPETWETQVSLKGNKASTWEKLFDHGKLPFMAMLRNLRNMIIAGISNKHHNLVIKKLTDEKSVIRSKQFPFRFFSAYEVLDELDSICKSGNIGLLHSRGRGRGRGRPAKKIEDPSELKYDSNLIEKYRKALDTALRISCVHNINPIPGTSIVVCDVDDCLGSQRTSGSFGKRNSIFEVGLLLGLMAKYSCEECKFLLLHGKKYSLFEIKDQATILANLVQAKEKAEVLKKTSPKDCGEISEFFLNIIKDKVKVDNIISFGGMSSSASVDIRSFLSDVFALNYRKLVNPKMLLVSVNLEGTNTSVMETGHPNNLQMFGYSDQLLRYVAERGNDSLMSHVDNIDVAYNLRKIKISSPKSFTGIKKNIGNLQLVKAETNLPCWKNVRVFISSTFRDMHGERDLLTRYIFPELRSRAMQHFINIYEIDLRWGITDEQSKSQSQVDICLSEVGKSDLFIGILGGRYGWIPSSFDLNDIPGGDRLEDCSQGKSITELEMRLFALSRTDEVSGKAFFYIRDQNFASHVPAEYESDFQSENRESEMKQKLLKESVKASGLEVFENYPCTWGGIVDGKPVVSNLEEFGTRVLNNIWTAVKNNFLTEDANEETSAIHEAFAEKATEHFVGRKSLIKQCQEYISTSMKKSYGVIVVSGTSGSGKTSFMAKLRSDHIAENGSSISYFTDAALNARDVHDLVRFIYSSLLCRVETEKSMPESFRELQTGLPKLLEEVGENSTNAPLVIFIDGIDMVTTTGRSSVLGWLPDPVPKGILFVISCLQGGACSKYLEARKSGVEIVRIGPLDMMERTELVRKLLRKHRKVLDESAFNNQMKLLVSKREAKLPIFLKFACEELRFFGVYEKVSDHLRKLAQTVPVLLQSIANRLENDHGKDLVSWCTIVLYISRQGLSEDELFEIICSLEFCQPLPTQKLNSDVFLQEKSEFTPKISRAFFTMLTRSLRGFIQQSDEQSLQLSFSDARNLVKQRYLRAAGSDTVTRIHRILAAYFKKRAFDGDWLCRDAKALSEVTYHMASGGLWVDLEETLCSFSFIYSKFQVGLGSNLLEDYLVNVDEQTYQLERPKMDFIQKPRILEYQSFIRRNLHILSQYPVLVYQQALNDPESKQLSTDAAKCSIKNNVIHWINKPPGSSPINRTMTGFNQAVLSLDVSPDGSLLACGLQDGVLRLFDSTTGNDAGSFIGHSAAISSCCFVGPQRIVSASLDGTLSVWDVTGGHRVHHLKDHRRGVTDCIHVPSSQQIVSVSLDCQAILWNAQNGSNIAQFKSGGRPLNCVSCHPNGQLVALAGWNCLIKIWDILANKRKSVLKGHESSVRAIAFSTSGEHLISTALLGDVYIWATASGVRVGKLSSESLELNHLKYTVSGLKMLGASSDSSVKVWSGSLGQPAGTFFNEVEGKKEWALSVTMNEQGSVAYVGYHDGSIVCFDYTNGKTIQKLPLHKSAVRSVCLSKCKNYLLTGSDDRTAKVVNLKKWNVITLYAHSEAVRCVRSSLSQFATCSDDYTIMLWNAVFLDEQSSIKPTATLQHHTGYVTCCDFSPCETRLMSVSTDQSLVIWDIVSLKPIHVLSHCHRDWITTCAWSDVGDFVVTGSNDFTLKLWDAKTGTEKYQFLGNTSAINAVAYKFGCVASTSFDGSLRIWTHKGAEITKINAHNQRVNNVCLWAPARPGAGEWSFEDVNSLSKNQAIKANQPNLENVVALTVSDDGTLKKWKPFKSHLIQNLNGHTDAVSNLAVSPNGEDLFSCSLDKTVKCWDIQKVEPKEIPHTSNVTCVKISPNGKFAATTGRDGKVVLWDLSSLKQINSFQVSVKSANCVCFTSDDKFVVGDDECLLNFMDINGTQLCKREIHGEESKSPVTAVECENNILACADYYYVAVLYLKQGITDVFQASYFIKINNLLGHTAWNLGLGLTNDGRRILTFHCHDYITLLNVAGMENMKKGQRDSKLTMKYEDTLSVCLNSINSELCDEILHEIYNEFSKSVTSAKFMDKNDSKSSVICGTSDGYVQIQYKVKCEGYEHRIKAFKAHEKSITGLKVLQKLLVTASSDTTVKVWELPSVQDERNTLKQIGLFFCRGPITTLDACYLARRCFILAGDRTGNVEILEFFE